MSDELTAAAVQTRIRQILKDASRRRFDPVAVTVLVHELEHLAGTPPTHATVQLFKPSGKWYTDEAWWIPEGAIGPWDMIDSPDFRRISGGPVLVDSQEPWGYPFLLMPPEGE